MANLTIPAGRQLLVTQHLAATETTQYACVPWFSVFVNTAVLTNTSASPVTVSLSVVKAGGTAGTSNRVVSGFQLAAGDTYVVDELEGMYLGPDDFISAVASAGSAVAFVMSGLLFDASRR